jgi:hypothetical protein
MLFRLAYVSTSLLASDKREREQIADILLTSRRNNEGAGITGALLATDNSFAQVLEGERGAVEATYRRIVRDKRPTDLLLTFHGHHQGAPIPGILDGLYRTLAIGRRGRRASHAPAFRLQRRPSGAGSRDLHEPDAGGPELGGEAGRALGVIRFLAQGWPHASASTAAKPSFFIRAQSAFSAAASFVASVERSTT